MVGEKTDDPPKLVQLNVPSSLWVAAQQQAALHGMKVATWIRSLIEGALSRPLRDAWVIDLNDDAAKIRRDVQDHEAGSVAHLRLSVVAWDAASMEADVLWKVQGARQVYAPHSFEDLMARDGFRQRDSRRYLVHVRGSGLWTMRQAFPLPSGPRAIFHYVAASVDELLSGGIKRK
jgi:hypothetical protein